MRISSLRTAIPALFLSSPFSHRPIPNPNPNCPLFPLLFPKSQIPLFRPMASSAAAETPSMEQQFQLFRVQLEGSGSVKERIRAVATDIDSIARQVHASLLLVHQSLPIPEVIGKARDQIKMLEDQFSRLAEILKECPGQYYRYHGDWRSETQTAVSLIAFLHWLETGGLLIHADAEKELRLDTFEFGLDIEDYLTGLCFMSNELPRYVVNQVTAGDYDCPRKVLKFLTELHASFRMLNLRNDFLRKKFDGMKYDLRRVEEVYYDVKIRGLVSRDSNQDQNAKAE